MTMFNGAEMRRKLEENPRRLREEDERQISQLTREEMLSRNKDGQATIDRAYLGAA